MQKDKIKQKEKQEILHLSFNQDKSYLAIGTEKGFKVFKCNPIKQLFSRQFGAGIGIVEMIHRTNIVAIVGGGKIPRYPKNKVMIWDDSLMKCIIETNCKSQVKAVKLKPDRCVIVLQTKVFVFNLADFKVLDLLETCPNPKGLCSIANEIDQLILALPSKKVGIVQITIYSSPNIKNKIQAHKSTLCALQLTPSGSKVATASEKGTIIRIFDTSNGEVLQELRRGSQYATIYSIAFDSKAKWLACSSDSGTIHIFSIKYTQKQLKDEQKENEGKNKKSKLAIFKVFNSYFDSQWSFAQFRISDKKTKVGFLSEPYTFAVATTEGRIYIVEFNEQKGGECIKKKVFDININNEIEIDD